MEESSSSLRAESSIEKKCAGARWHDPASYAAALGIIVFFLGTSLWISLKRLFWFDELMTFQIAGIPNNSTFWAALHRGFDGMPPLFYLIERFLLAHIHPPELALRLPSVLAVSLGALVVFDCSRRLTNPFFGLFGMGAVWASFAAYYSYEARSYALYFLCSTLAIWVWCHAHGKLGAVLFGGCFFAGTMMHAYFFMCLTPYALYECLGWRQRKWPSAKLIGGVVGLVCGILILYPELTAQRAFNKTFWAEPNISRLVQTYNASFPLGVAVVILVAAWLLLGRFNLKVSKSDSSRPVEIVSWLHVTIPMAGYFIAKLVTHAFLDRYFICFIPGLAVALACLCNRSFTSWSVAATGTLLILVGSAMGDQAKFTTRPEMADFIRLNPDYEQVKTKLFVAGEDSIGKDGKRFILLCEPFLFSQVRHYSAQPRRYHYLLDSHPEAHRVFNQGLLTALNDYTSQNMWTLQDLERNAADSAVVDLTSEDLATLQSDGFRVTLAKVFQIPAIKHPIEVYYLSR